jgi:ribonuclease D
MSVPITDAGALDSRLQTLDGFQAIGVDTEFLRERTYYAQLCLLQISSPHDAFCIDTLAIPTPPAKLKALMQNPQVYKVIHAARQDLEVMQPTFGAVNNVFDTQHAAALVGFAPQVGYGNLVESLLHVKLHKSQTRTDWSRRPLSPAQLEYAIDDVKHLLPLRELLLERLHTLGRLPWFEADSRADAAEALQVDPATAWLRVKGLGDLDPPRTVLAKSLGQWREQRAMQSDRPRGWILADISLREIVLRVPRSIDDLAKIAELTDGIRANSGKALLELVAAANIPDPAAPLPQRERPGQEYMDLVKRLGHVVRDRAAKLQLAPEILATRRDLERVAGGARDGGIFEGWRNEVIGAPLLAALQAVT